MMGNNIGGGLGNNMGTMGGGHGYDITDMTHPDDLAMMDDLERAKHYKSNIIQDFNDRQSMYSSRVGGGFGGPNAYNKSRPGLKGGPANSSPANRYGTTGPGGPGGPGGPSSHSPKIYTNDLNAYGTATGPAGAGADPYGYRDGPDMYNDGRGPRSRGLHPSEGDYGTGRGGAGAGGRLSRMR